MAAFKEFLKEHDELDEGFGDVIKGAGNIAKKVAAPIGQAIQKVAAPIVNPIKAATNSDLSPAFLQALANDPQGVIKQGFIDTVKKHMQNGFDKMDARQEAQKEVAQKLNVKLNVPTNTTANQRGGPSAGFEGR